MVARSSFDLSRNVAIVNRIDLANRITIMIQGWFTSVPIDLLSVFFWFALWWWRICVLLRSRGVWHCFVCASTISGRICVRFKTSLSMLLVGVCLVCASKKVKPGQWREPRLVHRQPAWCYWLVFLLISARNKIQPRAEKLRKIAISIARY